MLGYESGVINGQLVPLAPAQAFDPLTYGSTLSGPGYWPAGSQFNVPPLLPSVQAQEGMNVYSPDLNGIGGGSATPTAGQMNSKGKINFLHPTKSPTLWVVGLLGLSLWMLHKVHYGK